jgi:hypothetical protein
MSSVGKGSIATLIDSLGGSISLQADCTLVLAGIPAADCREGREQFEQFMVQTELSVPVVNYRRLTGEFASASAVAAALAVSFCEKGVIPSGFTGGIEISLDSRKNKILVLGFGQYLTAMEFTRL